MSGYNTTSLSADRIDTLHRDVMAHWLRWNFAQRRFNKTSVVLDPGCGSEAPLYRVLAADRFSKVAMYVGVDVGKIKKPCDYPMAKLIEKFDFIERNKELLAYTPECAGFTDAVSFEVIEHMPKELGVRYLKAIHSVLQQNGRLFISTPDYDGRRKAANHIYEWRKDELVEAIQDAGFDVEEEFGTFMDVKYIGRSDIKPVGCTADEVMHVAEALEAYYGNNGMSNIFAPLYPHHSRNCIHVCRAIPGRPECVRDNLVPFDI